jgi:hypothetical protein
MTTRTVTANISLTLDGRFNGAGGPADLSAIVPYATTEVARKQLARLTEGATTALLGRRNAEASWASGHRSRPTRTPTPATAATRSGWWTRKRWSCPPR